MTSEIRHPVAYYLDSSGTRKEIKATDLVHDSILETAQLNELTDVHGQVQLYARRKKVGQSHFVQKGQVSFRLYEGERDPTHDARVADLVRDLNEVKGRWSLAYKPDRSTIENELLLPPYAWAGEVVRSVERGCLVRHDVFGDAQVLSTSYLRPSVAIEVVHTHYPAEPAFAGMVNLSARLPYTVLFDHTRRPNTFVKVDRKTRQLIYSRWTFRIADGRVYQGHDEREEISSSAALKIALDGLMDDWDNYRALKKSATTDKP